MRLLGEGGLEVQHFAAQGGACGIGRGFEYETHPLLADSDRDGLSDSVEVFNDFDPLNRNYDNDDFDDAEELELGQDPFTYDLTLQDHSFAFTAGLTFGDAWDSQAAKNWGVTPVIASSFSYLAGHISSGLVAAGDIRDFFYNLSKGRWTDAAWSGVGVLPVFGDLAKTVRVLAKFAERSTTAVRSVIRYAFEYLPKKQADDVLEKVAKLPTARLPQDIAVAGKRPPDANFDIIEGKPVRGKVSKISKDPIHQGLVLDELDRLAAIDKASRGRVRDVRVNQRQVDAQGRYVGINRPDLQYTLDGKRYYIEWDKPLCSDPTKSRRGLAHQTRIMANDPTAKVGVTLLLIIAGTCE